MLKDLWHKLFAIISHQDMPAEGSQEFASSVPPEEERAHFYQIQDRDLEFLFNQLLEGVANGWQSKRIEKFFQKLEDRITVEQWLTWLEKYRQKLSSSAAVNHQLAARMIVLGESCILIPSISAIGRSAQNIGTELLNERGSDVLAESSGAHLPSTSPLPTPASPAEVPPVSPAASAQTEKPEEKLPAETLANPSKETELEQELERELEQELERELEQEKDTSSPSEGESAQKSNLLDHWFNLGLEKAKARDLEGAIACWERALQIDRNLAQAWHNRGSALAYLERTEEAIASFDQAIALNVQDYQSWNDRANALYSLGRWQEALVSWDRVISIRPNYEGAWCNRGLALEKLERWEEAIDSYETALEIDPNFQLAQKKKEKLLRQQGRD